MLRPLSRGAATARRALSSSPGLPAMVSADEAVHVVRSGDSVFIHSAMNTPHLLVEALARRAAPAGSTSPSDLRDVTTVSIHTEGDNPLVAEEAATTFRHNALFCGPNVRKAVQAGRADFTPCFLSEIPAFFRQGVLPVDVALVKLSPPDNHGYCSMGTSVDVTVAALERAATIVAEICPHVPRTHGDGSVHVSRLAAVVDSPEPVWHAAPASPSELHREIGRHVASVINDGACVQAGIGNIPDATFLCLGDRKDLGIHTEMFSDSLLHLIEAGVVTNEHKKVFPGKTVTSFAVGSKRLVDFVHDNPDVRFLDVAYVNDLNVIQRNRDAVVINSAIEIDLTGQVVADSIGTYQVSGVGGQNDFIRGASLSEGGKPIIALPARTSKGIPRIVPTIREGAGVVTTRAHVHYVATENGIVDLWGKTARDRARLLTELAHPDDREMLDRAAFERFKHA